MSFENSLKQVKQKPEKLKRVLKFSSPKKRKFGKNSHPCRRCGRTRGVIMKYGLQYCRQCFREQAQRLGFNKFS